MNAPATFSFDTPGDAERAAELRRVKALATLVLAATLLLFIVAKWLLPVHPVFGFIAAFAEAATIGGLADWYAVVALFKRPLGLPIPHTAIIQSNQARIADKLGEFIQVHFLEAGPVEAKLKEIDFGSFVADWLRDRKRSDDLARFALRLLPEAVSATESSGLMTFIIRRMSSQLQAIDLAPLAAGTLRGFVAEGRHQILFDDLLRVMHETLNQKETMGMIREKVRAELPTLLRLYRADKFLVNKIVASATAFFNEVRSDPKHPFRGEFDRMVLSFVDRLGTDQAYIDRIDGLKRDLLARPELADLARTVWANTRSFIERSASGETQVLQHHLAGMFVAAGEALAGDAELRGEINKGLVTVLRSFVADQKSGVSIFISDQVKAWDMAQLISLIEINIGRDLQYIRFNGSLIGGLAGLVLYSVEYLLRLL
ncbi:MULTISPECIES: DUF445 domain-containing protein [unclassified Bradyrhizobium]|uniref:DUF445 domain-containing protein n=1 Tax=unclassified Bradyrhizobium TaxID=2631580 RepID=UPI0008EF9879|nr:MULTISPECIES: DUF445 domain-containing protein [unclassified Bradyrhizobium]MBB4262515.1 uncharacterized membrane-anchored protein YjiN (DUF445 family) [Bradyrhizobium sp. CIR3A]MBB4382308.1 uncharacterized membrane-anchored protein YjiN (DUF445 family) [Bradyrhizobium sp. SBR1B]NYG49890.1 uncharacterized membrane-anchored protein YjiN (DUF445 family) [Bradyrhizobium sp. IAR9]SFN24731.1 Uncharacterized membrane-anchored protein YjiN, DUF445 family [Bradyrhizobium sp. Rc3b]